MKRLLMPVLIVLLIGMLAGCAPAQPPAPQDTAPAAATPAPAPEATPEPTAAPQEPEATEEPAPATPSDPSFENIKAKGYFILGLDDSFPPMGYRDENNEIVGFDIDLARECGKRMGVDVQLHPLVWDYIAEELNGKRVDVIWNGCTINPDRLKLFDFTKPYMNNRQVVVVLKDSAITTLADLKDKRMGIQSGSSANDALDEFPEVRDSLKKLNSYSDNAKALADLMAKRLDCVTVDETVFIEYNKLKPDTFVKLDEILLNEQYGVAVRKEDVSFKEALQKALDGCLADGTTLKLAEKWFSPDTAPALIQ